MASPLWLLLFFLLSSTLHSTTTTTTAKRTYIVQMNNHQKPSLYSTHHEWYTNSLESLASTSPDAILYSYTNAYHGFSAVLDPNQAESLRQSDVVLGVYEDTLYHLHTTRTPEFLGIENELGLWSATPHPLHRKRVSGHRQPPFLFSDESQHTPPITTTVGDENPLTTCDVQRE